MRPLAFNESQPSSRAFFFERSSGAFSVSVKTPLFRANRCLFAVPRVPSAQLHIRDSRVPKAMAFPAVAAQYAVLSLSY